MKTFLAFVLLAWLPFLPLAAEICDLVPAGSGLVLRIDLRDAAGKGAVRDDLLRQLSRQSGLDEKKLGPEVFVETIGEVLVVTPSLTDDYTLVFVKTKVTEEVFCRKLTEKTALKVETVKVLDRTEKRLFIPSGSLFPGISAKPRTVAFAFLEKDIAVFAKDTLVPYWAFKRYGIAPAKRRHLESNGALVTGFIEPDAGFLRENPFFPPLRLAYYSLAGEPSGGVRIRAAAECPDEKAASQVQVQLQQYVMLGGIFLNQSAPELAQEWLSMVRVRRTKTEVFLDADISASFIMGLSAASAQLTENLNPKADNPKTAAPKNKTN